MGHITMTAEEYNRYIELTNTMDMMGNLPGDAEYDESLTLLPQLEDLIFSQDYADLEFDDQRLYEIKRILRSYREMARGRLISAEEYPELGSKIDAARMKRRR